MRFFYQVLSFFRSVCGACLEPANFRLTKVEERENRESVFSDAVKLLNCIFVSFLGAAIYRAPAMCMTRFYSQKCVW